MKANDEAAAAGAPRTQGGAGAGLTRPDFTDRMALAVSSLHVRNYRLYFFGQALSVAGNFMQMLAVAFLTLQLTHSGTALGIATGVKLLPFLLLGPMGGVLADRYNKRRILFFTQTAQAAGALVFAALTALGIMNFPLLLVLNLILGCATILDNPARQSQIAELVDRDTVRNAVLLNSISLNVARIVGSVAGGTLVGVLGAPVCFLLNAVSFAAVIFSLARMDASSIHTSHPAPRERGQVRAGLNYAFRTPELALPLLMLTVTGILAFEFPNTLPLLATGAFHGTAGTYALLSSLMAAGSIIGGVLTAMSTRQSTNRTLALVCIGWGAAIIVSALMPNIWSTCIALVFVGYGSISFNSSAKTVLQLASRPDMRGRVMALWGIGWGGSSVIGAPLVGWFAEMFGSRWGLLVGGGPTLLLGLIMLIVTSRHTGVFGTEVFNRETEKP